MRRKPQQIILSILLVAVVLAAVGGFFLHEYLQQKDLQVSAANSYNPGSEYREIEYKGEKYRYNNRVSSFIYAGVDSTGSMETKASYGNAARADSIALIVMNEQTGKLNIINISRDTMTEVRRYTRTGADDGLYKTHLAYAYTYGDGGRVSCQNLAEAVSHLFGDIPIRDYVITNQDSMPYFNSLVGGITVTVPNSDLDEDSEFEEGSQVEITADNINRYLRYRDTDTAFSNEGRIARQKSYSLEYLRKVQSLGKKDLETLWESTGKEMKEYLQTSLTKSKFLSLIQKVKKMEFSEESYEQLAGTDSEGQLHDEFYPDEQLLQDKIIELFYYKVS